ncbi:MAG: hypothetical protein ABIJ61_14315, partial [bacterium]
MSVTLALAAAVVLLLSGANSGFAAPVAQPQRAGVSVTITPSGSVAKLQPDRNEALEGQGSAEAAQIVDPPILIEPVDGATLNWGVAYDFTWTYVPGANAYEMWLPGATPETLLIADAFDTSISLTFNGSGFVTLDWTIRGTDTAGFEDPGPWASPVRLINLTDATAPPTVAPGL